MDRCGQVSRRVMVQGLSGPTGLYEMNAQSDLKIENGNYVKVTHIKSSKRTTYVSNSKMKLFVSHNLQSHAGIV